MDLDPNKILEYVKCSQAGLEAAEGSIQKTAEEKKAYAAGIPATVDALVAFNRIPDTTEARQKMAQLLADPVQALELLKKAANTAIVVGKPSEAPAPMGKAASANPPSVSGVIHYPGQRTPNKSEADAAFDRIFNR